MENNKNNIYETPTESGETNILNFILEYNNNKYNFSLIDIDNYKIKIQGNDYKENNINIYEAILELKNLKTINKYFKMFDDYEEFKNDFIELCKSENIKINNINTIEMIITIDLMIKTNNLLNISLKKVEINDEEQMKFILTDLKNKNEKINDMNIQVGNMKKKIISLENNINELNLKLNNIEKIKIVQNKLKELKNKFSHLDNINNKKNMNLINNIKEDFEFIIKEINLTKNEEESKLIELNDISFKNIGKTTYTKTDLYFYKDEESSKEIYFVNDWDIKNKLNIELKEDLTPLMKFNMNLIVLKIDEPIIGKNYTCNIYIKSDRKKVIMKKPLKININIVKKDYLKIFLNKINSSHKKKIMLLISSFLDKKSKYNFLSCSKNIISYLVSYLENKYNNILEINKISLSSPIEEQINDIEAVINEKQSKSFKKGFSLHSTTKKLLNILDNDKYNNIFKQEKLDPPLTEIIIIYRIFFLLTNEEEITKIKNDNFFWDKARNYILRYSKGKTGTFFINCSNKFIFSNNNIFKIKKLIYENEDNLNFYNYSSICKTTGYVFFMIKDSLDYCGLIKNENKNNLNVILNYLKYIKDITNHTNEYISKLKLLK